MHMKKGAKNTKKVISNEDVLKAVLFLTENMVTKEEFVFFKSTMTSRKHVETINDNIDILGEEIDTVQADVGYMRGEIALMPTKEDLAAAKEEIIEHFEPLEQAFDKDAEIIVNYGVRLERIEKHLAIQ